MSEIVPLRGGSYSQPGMINDDVVKQLEWLLEAAKSGQINGLVFVSHWSDLSGCGHGQYGFVSYHMVGRLELLKSQMLSDLSK